MRRHLPRLRAAVLSCMLGLVLTGSTVSAQSHPDSSFAVVLYGGAGITRYVAAINTPVGVRASLHPGGAAFTRAVRRPGRETRAAATAAALSAAAARRRGGAGRAATAAGTSRPGDRRDAFHSPHDDVAHAR